MRAEAIEPMQQQATELGANAILNIRFATSSVAEGAADLYALERIINRYGHGGHTMEFFKRLETQEAEGKLVKVSEYFSTHPQSKERIERLMLEAEKQNWKMQGNATSVPNF